MSKNLKVLIAAIICLTVGVFLFVTDTPEDVKIEIEKEQPKEIFWYGNYSDWKDI